MKRVVVLVLLLAARAYADDGCGWRIGMPDPRSVRSWKADPRLNPIRASTS